MSKYFKNVIGQSNAVKKLEFFLDGYLASRMISPLLFVGCQGQGKSYLAIQLAKELIEFDENGQTVMNENGKPKKKPLIEVNGATIKSLRMFVENVLVQYCNDKSCTLYIDEIHAAPLELWTALLTILNPNESNKTTFSHGDYVLDFDLKKISFILATSEPQKLIGPLKDRLQRIELEDYRSCELSKIVQKNCEGIEFTKEALDEISSTLRGNARNAVITAKNILCYLKTKKTFDIKDWEKMSNALGILPLGLTHLELSVLRHIKNTPGLSLTNLASKMGLTPSACRRDVELFCLRNSLLCVEVSGRHLTSKGLKYLADLGY